MISQQTKKELSYLWNQAKDLFSFNETFVEPLNLNLNAPENRKNLEIIEAFKWDRNGGRSIIRKADDPDYNHPDYGDKITKGIYTPKEILSARLVFNAAKNAIRYFNALARQDKISYDAINDFYALENILVPGSTFDAANISVALATPFQNNPAAVNINEVFETANYVTSCRYNPGEFILNEEDVFNKKTRSFSNLDAVSLLDRADKKEGEFDLTIRYPDDERKIDEALRAIDEYCIRDAFLKTALKEAGYTETPFDDLKDAITLAAPRLMEFNGSKDILEGNRLSYAHSLIENEKRGYIRAMNATVEDFLGTSEHRLKDASKTGIKTKLSDGLTYTLTSVEPLTHKDGRPDMKMHFTAPASRSDDIDFFKTDIMASDLSTDDLKALSEQLGDRLKKQSMLNFRASMAEGPFGDGMRTLKEHADRVAAGYKRDNYPGIRRLFIPKPEKIDPKETVRLMKDIATLAENTFLKDGHIDDDNGSITWSVAYSDRGFNPNPPYCTDCIRIIASYDDHVWRTKRPHQSVHEISITPDGKLTLTHTEAPWGRDYYKDTPAMMFYNKVVDNLRRFVDSGCTGIDSEDVVNKELMLSAPLIGAKERSATVRMKTTDSLTPTPGGYILNTGDGFRLLDKDRHDTMGGITVDAFSQIQNNVSVARVGGQYALVNLKTNKPLGGTLRLFSYAGEMTPDGLALIRTKDLRFNYLKPDGTFLSKEGFERALPFKDGKASVTRGGRNFVIDSKGVVVEAEQLETQQTLNKGMKV